MKPIFRKIISHDIIKLLITPPYLYFALSVIFSQIAFNMFSVVLIFLVFFITSSNFAVSILLLILLLPQILLSFIGGVFADAQNKKKILIFGNFFRALVILLLFINPHSLVLVYFVTFVVSVITQFYVPAEAPLIPKLVPKSYLVAANTIFGIGLFGSILLGYVAAGPVINVLGRSNVFLVLSTVFLFAGIFAIFIPYKLKKTTLKQKLQAMKMVKRSINQEFSESYRLLKKTGGVGGAFVLLVFSQVIILILATLIPGYAKNILQVPAEDLSMLLFAPAALGMIVSGLIVGTFCKEKQKQAIMTIGVFMSGIVLFLLPFTSRILSRDFVRILNMSLPYFMKFDIYHFVFLLAFFAGFANAFIFIPSQAIIQEVTPEDFRSKIYGLLFAAIGVFSLIPIIVAGGVADVFGVGKVLLIIGFFIILIGFTRIKIPQFIKGL